jgi:hypothetical protein
VFREVRPYDSCVAPSALILYDGPMILICIIPGALTNISDLTGY